MLWINEQRNGYNWRQFNMSYVIGGCLSMGKPGFCSPSDIASASYWHTPVDFVAQQSFTGVCMMWEFF